MLGISHIATGEVILRSPCTALNAMLPSAPIPAIERLTVIQQHDISTSVLAGVHGGDECMCMQQAYAVAVDALVFKRPHSFLNLSTYSLTPPIA
jgi:hypothetical protein